MIKLKNVKKYFKQIQAVDNCNLEIKNGELAVIAGGDGTGKTTLIKMIAGLLNSDEGYVLIDEKKPYKKRANIGYMAQTFSWYKNLTIEENVILSAKMHGLDRNRIISSCKEILYFVNLWKFRERLAGNLSGGMKQKLALAATLIYDPDIVLLDEPTTGVDPVSRQELWDLVQNINNKGTTIVVATPYFDEVTYAQRAIYMNKGKIILDDTLDNLQMKYQQQNLANIFLELTS